MAKKSVKLVVATHSILSDRAIAERCIDIDEKFIRRKPRNFAQQRGMSSRCAAIFWDKFKSKIKNPIARCSTIEWVDISDFIPFNRVHVSLPIVKFDKAWWSVSLNSGNINITGGSRFINKRNVVEIVIVIRLCWPHVNDGGWGWRRNWCGRIFLSDLLSTIACFRCRQSSGRLEKIKFFLSWKKRN